MILPRIDIDAPAKINLTLDVLYKRPDGYHEVEMIMQSIALKDHVTLEPLPQKVVEVFTDCPCLPAGENNLAYKAAKLMISEFNLDAGVKITINKNIPLAAGLAGGSSDAAAVILGMNELFDLKKSRQELMTLGKRIGADVPFCIHGGTALARGIGEKVEALKPLPKVALLLVKPPYLVSTREVYSRLDVKAIRKRPDTPAMVRTIEEENIYAMAGELCNVLEEVTFSLHPELESIKEELKRHGALGSLMSGSGPTVFGIFESEKEVRRAREKVSFKDSLIMVSEVS
jgi:4-diphosphocytidyl-2-C-methyl-D-erythritol kinase